MLSYLESVKRRIAQQRSVNSKSREDTKKQIEQNYFNLRNVKAHQASEMKQKLREEVGVVNQFIGDQMSLKKARARHIRSQEKSAIISSHLNLLSFA